ncbi:MAG: M28 family peptidase [Halobacteriota archaeon]|uniref:M28 family peptidase n=1 Tax=Natronomonas sp. TaxID=2184060 RepID=UPI00286FE894|nr:M28 family peptidase [Natronomonas sp.]MDR9431964.1 M28 family peptidase [Natronomonas sp.]
MFESIDRETESELVDAIDRDRLTDHVDRLAKLTRHSGSEGERAGTDYVVEQLREYGVDVEYGEYEAYVSDPDDAAVTVIEPTKWTVPDDEVITVAFGATTPPAGVHGDVAFVSEVTDEVLAPLDLGGKIAFTPGLPTPGPVERLADAGAEAAVFESPTEGHCHEMIVTPVWGTPGVEDERRIPSLPVVEVSQSAGERLRDQIGRGPVEAVVETSVTTDLFNLPCPVGRIEGRESDRYYVIGNHVDSWHRGVTDNATAVAATLELARVFSEHDEPPRRGLLFGFWTAHSFGRYAGSTWFVDDRFSDLRENGLAYIHLDLNGLKGAERLWYQHMAAVEDEHLDALDTVPDLELPKETGESSFLGDNRPGRNSDQSFWGVGLVSLLSGARLTPETPEGGPVGGGWWWHTPEDTRDKVDLDVLVEETKLYAALAARICESPIPPFDHAKSAAAVVEVIKDLGFEHPVLSDLRERAGELERTIAEANRIADIHAADPAVARAAEELQVKLGNRLIPALYKARPDHRHDGALSQGRLPGIATVGDPDERSGRARLFAETSLRREVNRIEDQLRESRVIAAAFVDEHGE